MQYTLTSAVPFHVQQPADRLSQYLYSLAEDGAVLEHCSEVVLVAQTLLGTGIVERLIDHALRPVDRLSRPVQAELGL